MILTIEEARDILRLDGEENDVIIKPLLQAIPPYLKSTTGNSWDKEPINPLAKTTASFILQLWFEEQNRDSEILKRTIDNLLITLTTMRSEING